MLNRPKRLQEIMAVDLDIREYVLTLERIVKEIEDKKQADFESLEFDNE